MNEISGAYSRTEKNASMYEQQQAVCRQLGAGAPLPIRDASPVEAALNELSANIEAAIKEMDELAARLIPVSDGTAAGNAMACGESPCASQIEGRIESANRHVCILADMIRQARMGLRI